jgi:hypothetical protein
MPGLTCPKARVLYNKQLITSYLESPIDYIAKPPWKCQPLAAFTFNENDEISIPSKFYLTERRFMNLQIS